MRRTIAAPLAGLTVLAAALAMLALPAACPAAEKSGKDRVVYFFNWSEYLPEAILEDFTRETGIRVVYTTYDSNEAMYAKLKFPTGAGYDLVVPSTYFISKMAKEGMLLALDRAKLPNFANLDPKVLDKAYDRGNRHSVPYLWGSTGLAFDSAKVDAARMTSWEDLWRPEFKGKLLLQNDPREVFHLALRTLGHPGNSTDPAQIEQAYEKLRKLMPNVRIFNSDSPKTYYLQGEVTAGMIYNGEANAAAEENPRIRFVYPREGAIFWVDSLAIPAGARNVDEAHRLIDYLLRPDIARRISEEIGYATPNAKALLLLDPKVQANRTVYPAPEELARGEFQVDVGDAITLYEKFWEKLKAGR
jgi:spermidine/putrescine transport system substrate-binding protein